MMSQPQLVGFIAVHVGAGNHSDSRLPEYKRVCKTACRKAIEAIRQRKTALDALTIAIKILEDYPLTNAGTGSNLSLAGSVECDAGIMDGTVSGFAAVGAIKGIQNPIMVAKKLLEEQNTPLPCGRVPPMFLCGTGAHDWAVSHGIAPVCEKSLVTENAVRSFKKYANSVTEDKRTDRTKERELDGKERKRSKLDGEMLQGSAGMDYNPLDTVGAVCMDCQGNLCAGVSSGGLLLKYPGRIGQAAVYGSGCWASNITNENPVGLACCSSGCGEQLIKTMICKECADLCLDRSMNRDGIRTLQELLQDKFLGSPCLNLSREKLAGIIFLRCQNENSSKESKFMNVEFAWGHTTHTMAVGYMAADDHEPKFQLTRLENCAPGSAVLVQGIMKRQNLDSSQTEETS